MATRRNSSSSNGRVTGYPGLISVSHGYVAGLDMFILEVLSPIMDNFIPSEVSSPIMDITSGGFEPKEKRGLQASPLSPLCSCLPLSSSPHLRPSCTPELWDRPCSPMGPQCLLFSVFGLLLLLLQDSAEASILKYSHSGAREKAASPEEVVRLLKDHAITRFRLYDANHSVLRALGNSSIKVIVGVHNGEVEYMAGDSNLARIWVERNILPFIRDTNVTTITVGDEAFSQAIPLSMIQEQAMRNLQQGLVKAKLDLRIKVSTPYSLSVYTNDLFFASLQPSVAGQVQEFVLNLNYISRHRRLADDRGYVWCVVNRAADVDEVQAALDWVCARVNCGPTYIGGSCFRPDTIWDHASWSFNAYYNSKNGAPDACNFSGTAYVSSNDPSSEQCFYQGTNRALAVNTASTHGRTATLSLTVSLLTYLLARLVL